MGSRGYNVSSWHLLNTRKRRILIKKFVKNDVHSQTRVDENTSSSSSATFACPKGGSIASIIRAVNWVMFSSLCQSTDDVFVLLCRGRQALHANWLRCRRPCVPQIAVLESFILTAWFSPKVCWPYARMHRSSTPFNALKTTLFRANVSM